MLGWQPMAKSWLHQLPASFNDDMKAALDALMNRYIPPLLEFIRKSGVKESPKKIPKILLLVSLE